MKIKEFLIEGVKYKVGDIIEYEPIGGGKRTVLVDEKEKDIKNGYPGFGGKEVGKTFKPIGKISVWGYDDQIIRVVKKK
jgi:hypothetical protein